MNYLRLLRLQDQYIEIGFVFAAGTFLHVRAWWIVWWALACLFLSFVSFIANQLTDQQDVDRYSTNSVHLRRSDRFRPTMVVLMIAFCVGAGLGFAWISGRFVWGVMILILGVAYSAEPFRWKRRLGLDIVAQLGTWFILPFAAVIWRTTPYQSFLIVLGAIAGLSWCIFYPYQLADIAADTKATFRSTHVILGMRNSLWLGITCGVVGLFLFIAGGVWSVGIWSWPIAALCVVVLGLYIRWLRMKHLTLQTASMASLVGVLKPVSQLMLPYIFFVWLMI